MPWFPIGKDEGGEWRLDIVALLAVTGESFIEEHAQAITSSALGMLPRIMPAPHALLKPRRPANLPVYTAKVAGVYSAVLLDSVGFFANIIHPLDQLRPFAFRVLEIKHRYSPWQQTTSDYGSKGEVVSESTGVDPEGGSAPSPGIRRRRTVSERVSDVVSNSPLLNFKPRPTVVASLYSPLHIISFLSFLMAVGLIAAAAVWGDGTAVVAICLISIASSVIGYAAWWRPTMMTRPTTRTTVSPGDMLIRTREGAFILIKCAESVAQELYSSTDECKYYVDGVKYRLLMTAGAVIIMPSVILMGNCTFNMQVLIGVAYMILNVIYWCIGLLPMTYFWDLSQYEITDVTPADARNADYPTDLEDIHEGIPSYTRTLWYAIRETKKVDWVHRSGAIPATAEWNKWAQEAHEQAKGNKSWQAVTRRNEIMMNRGMSMDDEISIVAV